MTATNHVVMGALVATYVHNPWVAIPVAFASHFILDSIPHFDYPNKLGTHHNVQFFVWLAMDCGLAGSILLTLLFLQPAGFLLTVACGIAAASPDTMWLYYLIYKKGANRKKWPALVRFHKGIQKHTSPKLWPVELSWLLVTSGLLATRLY